MILEDFSTIDSIDTIENNINDIIENNLNNDLENDIKKSTVNLHVDDNNNVVISLNINDDIIEILNRSEEKDNLKIEFFLSKDFYLSLVDSFKKE
jgi:hypothetical protein